MCVSLSEPYLMENYTSLAEVDNIFMWKLMVIVMIHGLMDGILVHTNNVDRLEDFQNSTILFSLSSHDK